MSKNNTPNFIYYAHHKCASSWVNRFLWKVTAALGVKFDSYHSDEQAGGSIPEASFKKNLEVVTIRNARWDHVSGFEGINGVHVIRDPRDVIVSGYFSHLKTHELIVQEMADERKRLQKLNKEDGLIESMHGMNGRTLKEMSDWKYGQHSHILEMRLEEMSQSPDESLCAILRHAGWIEGEPNFEDNPLGPKSMALMNEIWRRSGGCSIFHKKQRHLSGGQVRKLMDHVSFKRLSGGRAQGETNTKSHYRKGKHGDWVNHFSPAVEKEFKKLFPSIVSQLNYEVNENWSAES